MSANSASSHEDRGGQGSSVVVVCMPEHGHVQRMLPVIEAIAARGRVVHVLTASRFSAEITRRGGRFVDLFARYPLDHADATSTPIPSRYVSSAGAYAEALIDEIARLAPSLLVYDTFSVVAPIVARRLGVPYVNVCSGHALVPSRIMATLRDDPRVATSDACWRAVARLKTEHGLLQASPFSYVDGLSPWLNLYCEPPQFLPPEDRRIFEPLAFFGSLAGPKLESDLAGPLLRGSRLRIYVSFGTVVWRYYAGIAAAALVDLAAVFSTQDVEVVMSLGGHDLSTATRAAIARPNITIADYVDQESLLKRVDAFVTHHGLNSTHEAIVRKVPMLSYPFFWDQPALARRCEELGLAVRLVESPQAPIRAAAVLAAMRRLAAEYDAFAARLEQAREWELRTIAGRGAVIDRILALAEGGAQS